MIIQGKIGEIFRYIGFSLQGTDLLISFGIVLICIFLVKAIVAIQIHRVIMRFIIHRQIKLQTHLMETYQNLSYINYMRRNTSEYVNSIGNLVMTFTGGVLHNILHLLSELMVGIVVITLLAFTNISALGILLIILGTVIFLYDKIFRSKIKNYGKIISDGHQKMLMGVQEGFGGFKEIRILGKNAVFKQIVEEGANYAAMGQIKSAIIKRAPVYLFDFVVVTFMITFIISFMKFNNDLNSLIPTLGIFTVATLRLKPVANTIINGITSARLGRYAVSYIYKDIKEMESQKTQSHSRLINYDQSKTFSSIVLKGVSFQYPNAEGCALENLSISLNDGESIGLIGPSGSGKTTLVDVFLGLLEPQEGEILYNNIPLRNSLQVWQNQVAYLPQEVFLFDNTLKQNIALSINNQSLDNLKIKEAIRQAQLTELVDQLPNGIETILGEHGVRLSGGQRQRVAIARAFYHQRNILIMDEATSSLDNETEKEIVEEIRHLKKQKTIIVIAHRLSTVKYCDKIYRLDKGSIIETGSYDQVVNNQNIIEVKC